MNRGSIHTITESYLHNLDTLYASFEPVMVIAHALRNSAASAHLKELEVHGQPLIEAEEQKQFRIAYRHLRHIDLLRRKHERAEHTFRLLPRSFLVSLIHAYNSFIESLIPELLRIRPAVMDGSQYTLKYKDLFQFDDLEQARQSLARLQAESVLSMHPSDQILWLEKTFNLLSVKNLVDWHVFVAAFKRYHLYTRNDDVTASVSGRKFLLEEEEETATEQDARFASDKDFLIQTYECFYGFGVKLSQILWRRLLPQQIGQADASLNRFTDELLIDEKYDLARRILEFAIDTLPRYSSENSYRTFVISLALAYKLSGNAKSCEERLRREDWSACGDNLLICVQILRGNYHAAADYMKRIGNKGSVREQDYEQRPIFRDFRESDEFKQTFTEIFGQEPTANVLYQNRA